MQRVLGFCMQTALLRVWRILKRGACQSLLETIIGCFLELTNFWLSVFLLQGFVLSIQGFVDFVCKVFH